MKEMRVAEPVAPTTEEPPSTRQTSLSGGAHDEGDPTNVSGGEESWTAMGSLGGPIRIGIRGCGGCAK